MTKLGMNKRTLQDSIKEHKSVTKNRPGGMAFDFEDPAEYLLATIGSALFVEPKYHPDTIDPKELKEGNYNSDTLDEQAVRIIEACRKVAMGPNPRDVLALAHWARVEMNMRTTPQVMLAVAANCISTKPYVRRYVPRISRRADDVLQVVAAYEHLFGWKSFPASLKKGVADRMSKMSEYEIMKYNRKSHPSFKDLLRFCERKKGYPLSQELRHYIFTGEVLDPKATPAIAARKELTSRNMWTSDIPELARRARVTWEVLVSQFGSKPEVWAAVIPLMPYMALIRNVGNFLDTGLPFDTMRQVAARIGNAEAVTKSKQLPFRFMSLYRTLNPGNAWFNSIRGYGKNNRDRAKWDQRTLNMIIEAVEAALDYSTANIPELPGITCIASDNSGSMSYPISKGSSVTLMDTANILAAMVHKNTEDAYIAAFGNKAVWPPLSRHNSVLTNMNQIATYKANYRGQATNAYEVFKHLFDEKIRVDRIIVLSDMQCYDTTHGGLSIAEYLTRYRREVNPQVYAHFFDLKGQGTRQTPSADPRSNVVAGFSEKIFQQILMFESVETVKGERILPTLEYIRENY